MKPYFFCFVAAAVACHMDDARSATLPAPALNLNNSFVTPAGGAQVNIASQMALYATSAGLAGEVSRATGAETTLQGNINAEAGTRANAVSQLCALSGCVMSGSLTAPVVNVGSVNSVIYRDDGLASLVIRTGDGASFHFTIVDSGGHFNFGATATAPSPEPGDNSANLMTSAAFRAGIATGYTVATRPTDARRYTGAQAYITDATACAFNSSPTGGGSMFCRVTYTGSAWMEM